MAPPIIFNKSEPMRKVRVVAVKDQSEATLKALHEIGVLDVVEETASGADVAAIGLERDKVRESLRRIDNLLAYIKEKEAVALTEDVGEAYGRPLDSTHSEIELVYGKLERITEKANNLREELKNLQELQKYLIPFRAKMDVRLRDLGYSGGYLCAQLYVFAQGALESFATQADDLLFEKVAVEVDEETVVYTVAKVANSKKVHSIAEGLGGKMLAVPDEDRKLSDYLSGLDIRIPQLEKEVEELTAEIQNNVKDNLETIVLLKMVLTAEDERLAVLEKAYEAKYVTVVEGWVPTKDVESATLRLQESVDHVYIESKAPVKADEPPSKLKNVKGVKPFEVIVNLFSVPEYGRWDPTPIVAYFFAFFFGLMFADVIYGLAMLLCVKFLLHKLVDDPTTDGFKLFRKVLYISGFVGLVVGLLAGNYLGDIHFRPLGLVENDGAAAIFAGVRKWLGVPINFLELSLWVGLLHVNIAHGIGLYQGIKQHNKAVIISKVGLFVTQITLIPFVVSTILKSGRLPAPPEWFIYAAAIGILMIIIAAIMERGGFGAIFWLFDLTGILGDTMSYARLAGVGLATFYLASAFNQVAQMVQLEIIPRFIPGVAGTIIGLIALVLILIAAHAINLFLGVLSGFVHSLRLCFVEFLMKFYEGGGREYEPFKLKQPKSVVVGEKT